MKLNYKPISDDVTENLAFVKESMKKISFDHEENSDIPRYTDMYKKDRDIITYYSEIGIPEILPEELSVNFNNNTFFDMKFEDIPITDEEPMHGDIPKILSDDETDPLIIDKFEPTF